MILFAWRARADLPLVVAANRDEFFARPSAPAAYWADQPSVLAGRDLKGGGSWLGVTGTGRFAAVTNFRNSAVLRTGQRSRGLLVTDFLLSTAGPRAFLSELHPVSRAYDGFNLLVGNAGSLYHYSNHEGKYAAVPPGVHGLSNHLLDTPWPKVRRGTEALRALLDAPRETLLGGLFAALEDRCLAQDEELPDTGVGLEWERALSAPFIHVADYGTRASTVLLVEADGAMTLVERSYRHRDATSEERVYRVGPTHPSAAPR